MELHPGKILRFRFVFSYSIITFILLITSCKTTNPESQVDFIDLRQNQLKSEAQMYFTISKKYEKVSNTICSLPIFGRSYEDAVKRYQKATKDQSEVLELEQQIADNPEARSKFLDILIATIPLYTIPVRTYRSGSGTVAKSGGKPVFFLIAERVMSEMPAKFRVLREGLSPVWKSIISKMGSGAAGSSAKARFEFMIYLRGSLGGFVNSTKTFANNFVTKIPPKTLDMINYTTTKLSKFLSVFGNSVLAYQSFCTLANVLAASTQLLALEIKNTVYKNQFNIFSADKCAYFNSKNYLDIAEGKLDWCESNFANIYRLREQVNIADLIAGKEAKIQKCYDQRVKGVEVFPINGVTGVPGFRNPNARLSIQRHFGMMGVTALKYSDNDVLMAQVISNSKGKSIKFWTYAGALDSKSSCNTPGSTQITR